ncbi:hypothetical protein [Methylocella sp.]|uniref:hypothetical protein n=1 Tax=Methylocella sp. TaxID=1978226 RepID=UPI003784427F
MKQTTLSIVLEAQPESLDRLKGLVMQLREDEEAAKFGRLSDRVPLLHFMSISVFEGAEYDPALTIEVNFDGPPGPFWAQFEAALGADVRPMLRCCKRPADEAGPLYDAVTRPDSGSPLAAYFEARTHRPSVFHHGNRGLARARIVDEGALFEAARAELARRDGAGRGVYRGLPAQEIHARLRAALLERHPWLGEPAPERIPPLEKAADVARLAGFAALVVSALVLPGAVLALFVPAHWHLLGSVVLSLALMGVIYRMRNPLAGKGVQVGAGLPLLKVWLQVFAGVASNRLILSAALAYLVAAALAAAAAVWLFSGGPFNALFTRSLGVLALGLFSAAFVIVPAIVVWLRRLELRDSSQDAPSVDPELLLLMARREDRIPQNHMGSIVLLKPGILRAIVVRLGHLGLGLLLRVKAADGYLGSMRTIHFAHWAFVNNGSRLMFFSNFDLSWESYLDDFIEKAHEGLSLAWSCGVGFPPTSFLVRDGASHGRKFKQWARHSMAMSRFWYSAYKELTVDQIERNFRVAGGLRKPSLAEAEAAAWARDL